MSDSTRPISLTSRILGLNPRSKKNRDDDDELGEEITSGTVAGGGRGGRQTEITKNELRVSSALKAFLVDQGILAAEDAGIDQDGQTEVLNFLVKNPHAEIPSYLTDRSHPLPEYFISSSHNTYLKAHQLFGTSSADSYSTVLNAGSRCVEIDAWDSEENPDEPKVTHGYTLVSHISFRSICETIRDVFDKEGAVSTEEQGYRAAPILLSLENHCGAHGQLRLVQIMKEVWGDRLLSKDIRQEGHREEQESEDQHEHVRLEELASKIVVIVEHHIAETTPVQPADNGTESEDEDEEGKKARKAYEEKEKATPTTGIIPELADLGVYAQSVKPSDNSWYDEPELRNGPHHHLINLSESGLSYHLPAASAKISCHNAHHLMRVFPKGTRISSKNLNPAPFWGIGAQICALNWQTFGAGMQLNEALFSGSDGYVLKPAALRHGGNGRLSTGNWKKLRLHIGGATDVPVPGGCEADEIKPYVSCILIHPDILDKSPPKRKTSPYKQHKLGFLHKGENPRPTDPVWDETLLWEYEENELVFVRLLIKSDQNFAANPVSAVAAVRLIYAVSGWTFIRMLDLKGRETKCSLLVKFEVMDT